MSRQESYVLLLFWVWMVSVESDGGICEQDGRVEMGGIMENEGGVWEEGWLYLNGQPDGTFGMARTSYSLMHGTFIHNMGPRAAEMKLMSFAPVL